MSVVARVQTHDPNGPDDSPETHSLDRIMDFEACAGHMRKYDDARMPPTEAIGDILDRFDQIDFSGRRPATDDELHSGRISGRLLRFDNLTSQTTRVGQTTVFPVTLRDFTVTPARGEWKTNQEGMSRLLVANRVAASSGSLSYVRYFDDFPAFSLTNNWPDIGGIQSRSDPKIYVVQTSSTAIERCLLMSTDPGDLALDPTSERRASSVER